MTLDGALGLLVWLCVFAGCCAVYVLIREYVTWVKSHNARFEADRHAEEKRLSDRGLTRLAEQQAEREAARLRWREERYGDHHKAERAKFADAIRQFGGVCMERDCIMPSRRIEPGAYWELAHDHVRGGAEDYLGPAHPECNAAEARQRGVSWGEAGRDTDRTRRDFRGDGEHPQF